jgi:hypothetical protein
MGANFQFDQMLPGIQQENNDQVKDVRRQVEVFTHGDGVFLRIGPLGSENSGENPYTVELSKESAPNLRDAIHSAMQYMAWNP